METRPYFVVGDLLANGTVGALVAWVVAALIGPDWNMWVAMLIGMGIGMVLALPVALGFGALFGAMEVMAPVMVSGMVVGMVVSMWGAMGDRALLAAVYIGVVCALVTLFATYLFNGYLRREDQTWTS